MFQSKKSCALPSLFITPALPHSSHSPRRNQLVCQQSSPKQVWGRVKKAVPLSRAFADRYGDSALIVTGPQRFKLVCPFHNDKNPSLHISDELGTFHCFGCGASGSIIDLEQLASGHRSIAHALKSLSNRYQPIARVLQTSSFKAPSGSPETVEEPKHAVKAAQQKVPRRVIVTHKAIASDVLRDATLVYQRVLWDQSTPRGLQYFTDERKLSAPTLRAFACGYAPASPQADFLLRKLREAGYPPEQLAIAGAARSSREGMIHDLFRDRVIAPIRDMQGKTIALAGRALPHAPKSSPKYINSPETHLFKKKNVLFGADIAKDAPSAKAKYGYVIVVEGYMDVMTMFERTQGRIACVATMGTGVTLEQLHASYKLLDDCVDGKVIVNFDNDDAGIKALARICETVVLGAKCAHAIYIALPPSPVKDADEFMTEAGTPNEYVTYLLDAAKPWYEWYGNRIVKREIDRILDPETDVNVQVDLGITERDMEAIGFSRSSHELDLLLSNFLRQQRDDLLASVGGEPQVPQLSVEPQKRTPCSREVLDELAAVANSAAKTLPGLNVSALVHSWTDSLSLGEPTKLMPMFAYVMKKYQELAQPWRHLSMPVQVRWMRPPPWIQKELGKKKKNTRSLGSMDDDSSPQTLKLSPQELKRIRERILYQEQYIFPVLRERRCERAKMTKAAPRRAAEELILRALIFAEEIDRIDALEILLDAIIRCAQKKLPFWTSKAREGVFEYLSQLEGAPSPEEIAAYLEETEWWCEEIEELFIPIEEEDDPDWAGIRRLEIDHPIDMVETCALSIERMAGIIDSRRAIEKSGDVMQRIAKAAAVAKDGVESQKDALKEAHDLFASDMPSMKELDRSNLMNPAEAAERDKAMKKVNAQLQEAARKAQLFAELESGDISLPEWGDSSNDASSAA
ncbi:DNA primase [Gracilaria domingensis]|nr:DNA primase [Gracilaria domingensis]